MRAILIRLSFAMLALSFSSCANSQQPVADMEVTQENFALWRDFILPSKAELEFMKIPWRSTFKDGIVDATKLDRPVLLWTMNGHPLGCT